MPFAVKCPGCVKSLKVKDEAAGKRVRCPDCTSVFLIPNRSNNPPQARQAPRRATAQPPAQPKSNSTTWALIGGGLVVVVLLALLAVSVNQSRISTSNPSATSNNQTDPNMWPTFQHPLGFAQIDMPGTPVRNAQQIAKGALTFGLAKANFQMALTVVPIRDGLSMAEQILAEVQAKSTQQVGGNVISTRRMLAGTIPGLEMKIDVVGNVILMRYYVYSDALIGAEFITKDEIANGADRERFFHSLRGPDGNLIN